MCNSQSSVTLLAIILTISTTSSAQGTRYFKAEHGVGATYVKLAKDGRYTVVDREHMGVMLSDEGRWKQNGTIITFTPKDAKKAAYQATDNTYRGKIFLAVTSADAWIGIVIPVEDIEKDLDKEAKYLPDHVLFKIDAKTYETEIKHTYPFRYIGREPLTKMPPKAQ